MSGAITTAINAFANPTSGMSNPLEFANQISQARKNALDVQNLQGQQVWGQALLKNTDANGNVDYQGAARDAAQMGGPAAAMAARAALGDMATQRGQQLNNAGGMYKSVGIGAISVARDPSDANVNAVFDNMIASGLPAAQINAERQRVLAMANPVDRQNYAAQHGNAALEQLHQVIGQTTGQNVGGQIVPLTITQPTPGGPGVIAQGSGSVNTTLSPAESLQGGIEYPATQEDVQAGRATAIGQPVRVSGPDMITRFGLERLLPPGARSIGAPAGAGGGGGGVRDANGNPVSPNNPPRLNVTPPAPAAPQGVPAPPGGTGAAVPGANYNSGVGAALGASSAAPAAALPVRPPPPPVVPPPGAVAAPPPAPNPPPPIPPNAPRASLQGGVPVASANALQPNVGAPGAPSPLVPGDVSAIMGGMNRARGAPSTGTQTAFNTVAVGPGTEEAQGYKTSADKLASDSVAAANFQNTQFPYVQALANYGEGTKTGPTSDFWNQVAGTIRTPLAKLGMNITTLDDNTQRADALGKWLANIQTNNPVSAKSDAELAQVLKGSASTHINETTGADMVKAGLALQRMNVAATREWQSNPAVQQQYGTYLRFLGAYNQNTDPRAFGVDMLNPAQKQRLADQIKNGSEADAQRFEATLALARRNGMIGGAGSQAMP